MNIIVVRADGTFYTRPDTTLERDPKDFYLPDDLSRVTARNCTYIKIIKAGKAVPERFAARYFDAVGRGVLLYCSSEAPAVPELPYIDYSSYFFEPCTPVNNCLPGEVSHLCKEIERITRHISVRFADIIAFEEGDSREFRRGDTVVNGAGAGRHSEADAASEEDFDFRIC